MTAVQTDKMWAPLVEALVEALENHEITGEWKQPWTSMQHTNAATLRPYQSMNALALSVACWKKPRTHAIWATYKQWKTLDLQVKKGATGTALWTPPRFINKDADDGSKIKMRIHAGIFYVFNADDVEGFVPPQEEISETQRLVDAEFFLHKQSPNVVFGDPTRAFYAPNQDFINMPEFVNFKSPEAYYATLAHELVHWTGHKSRLDRLSKDRGVEYAIEELVAEFGSAMICSHLGIASETREDHQQYLGLWYSRIKSEPDIVRKCVLKASQAFNYINSSSNAEETA
jgi:antirestriction protein ArdC